MNAYWPRALVLLFMVGFAGSVVGQTDDITAADLIELDFEDLVNMDVEIESAGKNTARAMDLPYAASVITAADIRHSGAQNIPEALRLAPGLSVKQISAGEWAVGIRGGGGRFSRYVLIVVDGRIAYNSVYSGVNWDELNLTLSQIARIEVIRGPNAASWGANAVNGIINIISDRPSAEQTKRVDVWGGSGDRAGVAANVAQPLSNGWVLGLSGNASQRQGLITQMTEVREPNHDGWRISSVLSRMSGREESIFMADMFGTKQAPSWGWLSQDLSEQEAINVEEKSGWSVQASHKGGLGDNGHWKVRASAERTERDTTLFEWNATNYQLDIEVANTWRSHNVAVGFNSRQNDTRLLLDPSMEFVFRPADREINNYGLYVSDVIDLTTNLQLTMSARLDENELSQSEVQPSLRLIWSPTEDDRIWVAGSKATTTPARALVDIEDVMYTVVPPELSGAPLPTGILLNGYQSIEDDPSLQALELGYRHTFDRFHIDVALFDFDYRNDVAVELIGDPVLIFSQDYEPTHLVQRGVFTNSRMLASRGGELSMRGKFVDWWSAQFTYSRVERVDQKVGWSSNTSFMNSVDLANNWQWNLWIRHSHGNAGAAAQFSEVSTAADGIDDYLTLDTNVQWQANDRWRIELIANNLGEEHVETQREQFATERMLVEAYAMLKVGFTF